MKLGVFDSERFLGFSCFHVFFQDLGTLLETMLSIYAYTTIFNRSLVWPGWKKHSSNVTKCAPVFCSTLSRDFASTGTVMAIRSHEEHLEGQNDWGRS